ncbi:N-acetylneuraminate synthase family protein [Marivibrio halodurans]|uniref:N-acetylneuraminate synthase family protein n=1 Tax=Marivibrio halodurans TaxID=2039722 RepID=A0A8J7RZU6_9PROT|nr:N-acetylneuraminate synthase family protein [Marivibrio halodurans]MBP5856093.1 N-acetylneuraminate synthase family protein [Marivibrio halodurans]
MRLFGKDTAREVVLIAEIGVNHEGDPEKAVDLLHLAARAGADAVKFQSYTPERFVTSEDAARLERVGRFALDEAAHRHLKAEADKAGVAFLSTPVTEDWVPLLAELGTAIKIMSGDLTSPATIRAAARTGLPVLLSTGGGRIDEVDRAVGWMREEVGEAALAGRLAVLHCVSAYPTPMEEANLLSIPFMTARYAPVTVGYSNHVIGPEAVLAAVALGARVVEVHFTDRKHGREFRDHALSADPADMAYLARTIPAIVDARGEWEKTPQPCEREAIAAIRKGVVAARDLPDGRRLAREDLMFARPGSEIPAMEIDRVIGKRLNRALAKGAILRRSDLAE